MLQARRAQVGADGCEMDVFEVLDGLEFHDDGLLDEQIEDMLSHRDTVVDAGFKLQFHGNGASAQFNDERAFIDQLEKSWP